MDNHVGIMLSLIGTLLIVMFQQSMQLRLIRNVNEVVEKVNEIGPWYGFVLGSAADEKALNDSAFFVPNADVPYLDLAGRRYHIGKLTNSHNVIYVLCETQSVTAAVAVQIMIDTFDIRGIVHYGSAIGVNTSMSVGDVSVFDNVAFVDLWKWKNVGSEGELEFGDFNYPTKGENSLGGINFQPTKLYFPDRPVEEAFWIPGHIEWITIASKLKNLTLQQCVNETHCLSKTPKVVFGLNASTADICLDNTAYGEFLYNKFNVSTIDKESAAVVSTAYANDKPYIVFQGVSKMVGGEYDPGLSDLASVNALKAAFEFLGLILTPFLASS